MVYRAMKEMKTINKDGSFVRNARENRSHGKKLRNKKCLRGIKKHGMRDVKKHGSPKM